MATPGTAVARIWFGCVLGTAATFDVFPGLQVPDDRLFQILLESAPNGLDHVDVWLFCIFAQTGFPPVCGGQRFSEESASEQAEKRVLPISPEAWNLGTALKDFLL